MTTQENKKVSKIKRAALPAIRVARFITAACLVIGLVLLFFLLPFLFDSPKSSPLLILGVISSVPFSYVLSENSYRQSLAQENLTKAFFFAIAPLFLIAAYAGISVGIAWLTPDENQHRDAVLVAAEREKGELFIKTPEKCKPSIFPTVYSVKGAWKYNDNAGKMDFICDGTPLGNDSISIKEALVIPSVETEMRGNTRLHEKDGSFEIYRISNNNRDIAEVTKFTAYDGYQVSFRNQILSKNPMQYRVSRRLDDVFELTYSVEQKTSNQAEMIETDQRVAEYVKSIVHRKK